MPTSQKQIAANKRNAVLSTGPRTPAGQHASSLNSTTHGIFSRSLIVDPQTTGESREEFEALLARLHDEHAPQGFLEELLVSQIATQSWRLRRLYRCESGEIARTLAEQVGQLAAQHSKAVRVTVDTLHQIDDDQSLYGRPMAQGERQRLTSSSQGLRYLLTLLTSVRLQLETTGSLGPPLLRSLSAVLGSQHQITRSYHSLASAETQPNPTASPSSDRQTALQDLLSLIAREITLAEEALEAAQQREALEIDALRASLSLPQTDTADRILRYERTIQTQLSRAIAELQRLQAQRHAHFQPADAPSPLRT